MPIMTQIEARFWGEGAEQIHEWAKEGDDGLFFANVFHTTQERVFSDIEHWGSEFCTFRFDGPCTSSMTGPDCNVEMWIAGNCFPYGVFEHIALEFPHLNASGTYAQELGEFSGSFFIKDGEFISTPHHEQITELEQKALDGNEKAQLEMAYLSDDYFEQLMWAKKAALKGLVEAYYIVEARYQGVSWKSPFWKQLYEKWIAKIEEAYAADGSSPLIFAAKANNRPMLFRFIDRHIADINKFDEHGFSILHYAAKNKDKFMAKRLIEDYGMNPCLKDPRNPDSPTPLECAKEKNIRAFLRSKEKEYKEAGPAVIGPSGGYVFHDKGEYTDGWRYLEAAPADLRVVDGVPTIDSSLPGYSETKGYIDFGYYKKEGNGSTLYVNGSTEYNEADCTRTGIGEGRRNTQLLVDAMGEESYKIGWSGKSIDPQKLKVDPIRMRTPLYAAKLCHILEYSVNGVTLNDWFLPSKDELNLMYTRLSKLGRGNLNSSYWSSSEGSDPNGAWEQALYNGRQEESLMRDSSGERVRPIRAY